MKIAIDLNGGDYATKAVIQGIKLALKLGFIDLPEIIIVGTTQAVNSARLETKLRYLSHRVCPEIIEMHESAPDIRRRKNSTIAEGTRMVKTGEADAFVSAGNTAAMVIWGVINLQRIKHKISPAIAIPLPNERGPCLMLDAGAIYDANEKDLRNCAIMGSIYAQKIWQISQPIVRLLNIGREEGKGNETLKAAGRLLQAEHDKGAINFQGNIEGDGILFEPVNVIVCPGEFGNNTLKVAEGIRKFFFKKLGLAGTIYSFFSAHHKKSDHQEVGGAILLGVNGVEIIAHGKSQPRAIANAIRRAKLEVETGIVDEIRKELAMEPVN